MLQGLHGSPPSLAGGIPNHDSNPQVLNPGSMPLEPVEITECIFLPNPQEAREEIMEPMTPMDNPGFIKRRARQGPGVDWGDLQESKMRKGE